MVLYETSLTRYMQTVVYGLVNDLVSVDVTETIDGDKPEMEKLAHIFLFIFHGMVAINIV